MGWARWRGSVSTIAVANTSRTANKLGHRLIGRDRDSCVSWHHFRSIDDHPGIVDLLISWTRRAHSLLPETHDGAATGTGHRPVAGARRTRRRGVRQYVKVATLLRSSAAIRDSSSTAVRVWVSAWVVDSAAVETPVMLPAISVVPLAASCTDRDISFVVAVCSSTALAMVVCRSEICATIPEISSIAATAAVVSPWMESTRRAMSSVALAVSWASSLTSLATT